MTTNDKHTPVPYRVGDAGHTIFGPPNGNPAPPIIANVKRGDDARYLVNAANAYPALVAALREIQEAADYATRYRHGEDGPTLVMLARNVAVLARAALAQAEGGSK